MNAPDTPRFPLISRPQRYPPRYPEIYADCASHVSSAVKEVAFCGDCVRDRVLAGLGNAFAAPAFVGVAARSRGKPQEQKGDAVRRESRGLNRNLRGSASGSNVEGRGRRCRPPPQ
jgi:hypothetical protein